MEIYSTTSEQLPRGDTESLWIYNGLDCCLTFEVFEEIEPQLNEITRPIYEEALAMQAPLLEMMLRGVKIDRTTVSKVIAQLEGWNDTIKSGLQEILLEGFGYSMEFKKVPHYTQLQDFFYDYLGLPPVRAKGQVTTNRGALEKLRGYFHVTTICNHLIAIREIRKKLGVLYTGIDSDGRIRTSFNPAGTDTGRLSSSSSVSGSGTNLQNITEELRPIFIADPGKKLAYIDLEQAEARAVGAISWNLFHDGKYLDFCESGDLHTNVARMTFKHLAWTDDPKVNKTVASQLFYREDSYRQGCKKLGHATNYHGKAGEVGRQTRIPVPLIEDFQINYFREFPSLGSFNDSRLAKDDNWHGWVRKKLLRDGWITTFMGRQRWFFGRRWENETLNAAIAYEPQSAIAHYINRGLLALWRAQLPSVDILLQVHDALLIQYDAEREEEIIPQVQALMQLEVPLLYGRSLIIPTEAQVGWNWGHATNEKKEVVNPDGLQPFTGRDARTRSEKTSILARRF